MPVQDDKVNRVAATVVPGNCTISKTGEFEYSDKGNRKHKAIVGVLRYESLGKEVLQLVITDMTGRDVFLRVKKTDLRDFANAVSQSVNLLNPDKNEGE